MDQRLKRIKLSIYSTGPISIVNEGGGGGGDGGIKMKTATRVEYWKFC